MNVLITGATGFLGRHIAERLAADGHRLVCAVRNPDSARAREPRFDYVAVDFNRATSTENWLPLLRDIHVVVNAVGILRESPGQRFDVLHTRAPSALFAACARAGVQHVVQISALGADEGATTGYHRSKRAADEFLRSLPLRSTIVQPSLVFGIDGASARLFGAMASLPLIPLPGRGDPRVQPVHVDDLTDAIAWLVGDGQAERLPRRENRGGGEGERGVNSASTIAAVGPWPLAFREFLAALRRALGIRRPARFLPVPDALMDFGAQVASRLPGAFLDTDTLQMLRRGNVADPASFRAALGRDPRPVDAFIPRSLAEALRSRAKLGWLRPIVRGTIAFVWILTGIVSLGVYPVEASYALLAQAGVPTTLRPLALYGAALLDLVLGVLTLVSYRRPAVWVAQAALILGYTAIITLKLPEFWLHPYAPIAKNLPMLAAIWLLYELEAREWNT